MQDTSCLCKDAGTAGSYSSCRKDTAESEGKAGVSDERQSCSDFRESQQNIPGYRREWPVQADAACKYGKQENISIIETSRALPDKGAEDVSFFSSCLSV